MDVSEAMKSAYIGYGKITLLEHVKIQAQVLVPLLKKSMLANEPGNASPNPASTLRLAR